MTCEWIVDRSAPTFARWGTEPGVGDKFFFVEDKSKCCMLAYSPPPELADTLLALAVASVAFDV